MYKLNLNFEFYRARKFISNKFIVILIAKTGNDKINKIEVIIIDQENKFILMKFILKFFK